MLRYGQAKPFAENGAQQPTERTPDASCSNWATLFPQDLSFVKSAAHLIRRPTHRQQPFTGDARRSKIELDVVLRAHGNHSISAEIQEGLNRKVAAAAANAVRRLTYDELATETGMAQVNSALRDAAQTIVSSFGLKLVDVAIVDVRSKNQEWLLNARSDMQRRMDELEISKEWIDVHGEEIDLQALNNQLIIRRTQVNNAHKLEKRRADLEQELCRGSARQ